ncbi:MAG: DUF6502 family protein [Pseudomonadota bacterium]
MDDKQPDSAEDQEIRQTIAEIIDLVIPAMIATGTSSREIEAIVADRFIKHARRHYGIRKRMTNYSRVALMSEHTRKTVKRLANSPAPTDFRYIPTKHSPVHQTIHAWRSRAEYTDESGRPLPLSWEGDGSLLELIETMSGDVPAGAVRYELLANGYVELNGNGEFVLTGATRPSTADEANRFLSDVADSIAAIIANSDRTF